MGYGSRPAVVFKEDAWQSSLLTARWYWLIPTRRSALWTRMKPHNVTHVSKVSPLNPDESTTLAVVVERIDNLTKAFDAVRDDIRRFHEDKVSETVWSQQNAHVDQRFENHDADISEVKQEIAAMKKEQEARRTPATTIVSLFLSTLTIVAVGVMWLVDMNIGQG